MHITNVLLKKVKSKVVMVLLRSTGSNHVITSFRDRVSEKKEIIFFDPLIQMDCVYKEEKKIRGMKWPMVVSEDYKKDTYGIITQELIDKVPKNVADKILNIKTKAVKTPKDSPKEK